jgi:hypothetical protein
MGLLLLYLSVDFGRLAVQGTTATVVGMVTDSSKPTNETWIRVSECPFNLTARTIHGPDSAVGRYEIQDNSKGKSSKGGPIERKLLRMVHQPSAGGEQKL